MANTVNGLLTTYGKTALASIGVASQSLSALSNLYLYGFYGKVDSWTDDANPPSPSEDQSTLKNLRKNIVAVKNLQVTGVVPRFDWISGDVYSQYKDTQDCFTFDSNGIMDNPFYVRNTYDQVFKCLNNNNNGRSTIEPVIEPGSIQTSLLTLSDGYKWKYITTIDKGLKKTFFDSQWMPIPFGTTPNASQTAAGLGEIDVINVVNAGTGYSNGFTTTTVTITGDGTGAAAYANVSGGSIADVIVTNSGRNYTRASVTINSLFAGSGANVEAILSPIGGTGLDPISELGCNHIMMVADFLNNEHEEIDFSLTGQVPLSTDTSFRQVGVISSPILISGNTATGSVYNASDVGTLYAVSATKFISNPGELVYQGASPSSASWSATVSGFDSTNNIIQLINTSGVYTLNEQIKGATSGATGVLSEYTPTIFDSSSGYTMYYENRSAVQRSQNGNEQIRIVLRF